jgi:hypothetical protein
VKEIAIDELDLPETADLPNGGTQASCSRT